MLDIQSFVSEFEQPTEYFKRLQSLKSIGYETTNIENTVKECINNITDGFNSFVIYGEPQCGKTELMIALTAKLLDEGKKIVIILLNDNTDLLSQNLQRFRSSSINPSPINFTDLMGENIGTRKWIVFCKKNINDLKKLNSSLDRISGKIIIDDEGDYASPNGKINKDKKTKINEQIEKLLKYQGVYIGVTATPARLDLNNTFDNLTEKWVNFKPHNLYTGKEVFFPINIYSGLDYSLNKLPETGDKPEYIRKAIANFIVNVSIVNLKYKESEKYSFLIHTSGEVDDHSKDKKDVVNYIDALIDKNSSNNAKFWSEIVDIAQLKTTTESEHKSVIRYAYQNISNYCIVVLNSKDKNNNIGVNTSNPPSLFSIFIGGNKVSRGITFGNLLGMFFTRDAIKIQQDTYIQRARMFGNRKKYVQYFELWITESLYNDWHRCFVYHYLSLKTIETNGSAPVWIGDSRIRPVSPQSIDQKTLVLDNGTMAFAKFKYFDSIDTIIKQDNKLQVLNALQKEIGEDSFPSFIFDFIKTNTSVSDKEIAIRIRKIKDTEDQDYINELYRKRGTFGGHDYDKNVAHNLMITYNSRGDARLLYYYSGRVAFFKKARRTK